MRYIEALTTNNCKFYLGCCLLICIVSK